MKITTRVWLHCDTVGCQRKIKLDVDLLARPSDMADLAVIKDWRRSSDSKICCPDCVRAIESVGCHDPSNHPAHEFTNKDTGVRGICLGVFDGAAVARVSAKQADADYEDWMYECLPWSEPPKTIGGIVGQVNRPWPTTTNEISEWIRSAWNLRYPAWEVTESSVSVGDRDGSTTVFVRVRPILKQEGSEPEEEQSLPVEQCHLKRTHMAHRWGMDSFSGGKDRYNCPGALFDGRETTSLADLPPLHTIMWCGRSSFHPRHEWEDEGRIWQCEGRRVKLIRPPTTEEMRTYLRDHYGVEDGDGVPISAAPPVPRVRLDERICSKCSLKALECECEVFDG